MMPNLGWSTNAVLTFPLPITDLSYCTVIETEIIDVTEDGIVNPDVNKAVYFEGKESCVQPCTSLSVDPTKIEFELRFKIVSTISHSN